MLKYLKNIKILKIFLVKDMEIFGYLGMVLGMGMGMGMVIFG